MNKIKDLNVGTMCTITLVVLSTSARKTKANNPYLQLELYDGTDKISGNYWDWTSGKIPEKNSILDITAQVTEYMGAKQLTIKSMVTNTERHLSEFEPSSGVDVAKTYKDAYALASRIRDDFLRNLTLGTLEQLRDLWLTVPGAKGVHHAFVGGTLIHSLSVAQIAEAICDQIHDANADLCIAGGLLHDIGKLFTYVINGVSIDMTDEGLMLDHIYLGARFINNFAENLLGDEYDERKLQLLEHIILSHHGSLEYGAVVPPMCIEAYIVHHADSVDASVQQIIEASRTLDNAKWTDRIYTLNNRPQVSPKYVDNEIMRPLPF